MTGEPVTVSVQWAWHGKAPDHEGYRILACSSGGLSMRNFEEALSRFSPGMLDVLPQVSVSYLRPARQDDRSYLALAIHDAAHGDAERARFDGSGREITHTSYFCAPFAPLADAAIGYQAMHQAFAAVRLPVTDGPPIRVTMAPATHLAPAIDDLTIRTAALLLTGTPVCVLGAEATTVTERLAFIDTVMALLPYGMRSRMAAATWTRATHRDHHFRLFFSSAPRVSSRPDHIVTWGRPGHPVITTEYGTAAHRYYTWLADKVRQPIAQLADMTDSCGFGTKHTDRVLGLIGITDAGRETSIPPD
jgi:hypothetical protein